MWFTLYYIAQKQLHSTNTEAVEEKKNHLDIFIWYLKKKSKQKTNNKHKDEKILSRDPGNSILDVLTLWLWQHQLKSNFSVSSLR